MSISHSSDPEKGIEKDSVGGQTSVHEARIADLHDEVPRGKLRYLWTLVEKLDRFGVEARGIERVQPDERTQSSSLVCFWMWLAANMTISTFSLGTLSASVFELGLRDAVLTILFFNLITSIPASYFSTWGPKLGLRQLTLSRYSFGYFTALIPVILNCIACVGWSVVNSIVGGQTLQAVSTSHQIPIAAAIVVIAIGTIIVSFMGYRVVHAYEKYSWIPVFVIFIIYAGEIGGHVDVGAWGGSGEIEAASVLSYGATVAGFALGWTSLAADYSVSLPEEMSSWRVFWSTYCGMNLPMILVEVLGAVAMHTFDAKPAWGDAYNSIGVGGLLGAPLTGTMHGFGSFLLVLLALSIVANNIPNMYSLSVTFQVLGRYAQAIPRVFIVLAGSAIYIALAIVGATYFEEWLDTLLVILSYWLAIFSTILIEEHLIFRHNDWRNYAPDEYNERSKLPLGIASFLALGFGVMGAVLGMAQTWYVGVIGNKFGIPGIGGDIGFELSFAFTAVTYPGFRYFERKYWGA
ncbi:permease [Schizophyllum amplum]|uniref:Permease n=1 Tax=Schizophyllum amplum TaxID=97359 RepID=A0A550CYX2_9AGAR|nr:permease [Auriculariopsis ampla]